MDLDTFKSILAGERADDLSPEESVALERLLEQQLGARDALAQGEDELTQLVDLLEPPEPSEAAWERVTHAVRAQAAQASPATSHPAPAPMVWPVVLAVAAALALVVGLALMAPPDFLRGGNDPTAALVGEQDTAKDPVPQNKLPDPPLSDQPSGAIVLELEAGDGFRAAEFVVDGLLVINVEETM
jgi:anti-sigma-K factor RskA